MPCFLICLLSCKCLGVNEVSQCAVCRALLSVEFNFLFDEKFLSFHCEGHAHGCSVRGLQQ